jgi:hypothetical protein
MKTKQLGTVWTAKAAIQVIKDTRWETLAVVMDTPRKIHETIANLKRKGYKPGLLWVRSDSMGRYLAIDRHKIWAQIRIKPGRVTL